MKHTLRAISVASLLFAVAACASGGYVSASAGDPIYYDGFYDGFYGPFYDGYWGEDNHFYYSRRRGRPFVRDDRGHFRHEAAGGFTSFHHAHMGPHSGHIHESHRG